MSLPDVDVDELDAVAVQLLQPLEVPELGTIRPSGKAAENQDDRLFAEAFAQRD